MLDKQAHVPHPVGMQSEFWYLNIDELLQAIELATRF